MSSISSTLKAHGSKRYEPDNELKGSEDGECTPGHDRRTSGAPLRSVACRNTLFVFDDAYGWTASVSQPTSEADTFYRTCTIDLITGLRVRYDLDALRLAEPDDIF
jgi:hypothetical protein